jgi:hypothetical protein
MILATQHRFVYCHDQAWQGKWNLIKSGHDIAQLWHGLTRLVEGLCASSQDISGSGPHYHNLIYWIITKFHCIRQLESFTKWPSRHPLYSNSEHPVLALMTLNQLPVKYQWNVVDGVWASVVWVWSQTKATTPLRRVGTTKRDSTRRGQGNETRTMVWDDKTTGSEDLGCWHVGTRRYETTMRVREDGMRERRDGKMSRCWDVEARRQDVGMLRVGDAGTKQRSETTWWETRRALGLGDETRMMEWRKTRYETITRVRDDQTMG